MALIVVYPLDCWGTRNSVYSLDIITNSIPHATQVHYQRRYSLVNWQGLSEWVSDRSRYGMRARRMWQPLETTYSPVVECDKTLEKTVYTTVINLSKIIKYAWLEYWIVLFSVNIACATACVALYSLSVNYNSYEMWDIEVSPLVDLIFLQFKWQ